VDESIFLSYAINIHAYKVYNKILMIVEEFVHVVFDETYPLQQDQRTKIADDEDILQEKQTTAELEFAVRNHPTEKEI